MSRYVRYEDVGRMSLSMMGITNTEWVQVLQGLPSIEIITCEECEWSKPNIYGDLDCTCHVPTFRTIPQGYCWRGERKNDDGGNI